MHSTLRLGCVLAATVALTALPACNVSVATAGLPNAPVTGDRAPVIAAFDYMPKTGVGKDDAITFTLVASDPEGQPLQYNWTSTKGTLSGNAGATVSWKPVKADGSFEPGLATVTVIATDGRMSSTATANIQIAANGQATVTKTDTTVTATAAPSTAPSATPTAPPSAKPTAAPSAEPSAAASVVPSAAPTDVPASPGSATVAEQEPNDDFDQAQVLTLDQAVDAKSHSGDQDYYKITVPAGAQHGVLRFKIDETSPKMQPHFTFFSESRAQLDQLWAKDGTSTPSTFEWNAKPGATYYVVIDDASDLVPYKLTPTFKPVPDANEPNDDFDQATPLTAGEPMTIYSFSGSADDDDPKDEDFFKLEVPATAAKIVVKIANKSTALEPQQHHIRLYGADKSEMDQFWAPNGRADLATEFDLEAGGTYYLSVDAADGQAASTLTVTYAE